MRKSVNIHYTLSLLILLMVLSHVSAKTCAYSEGDPAGADYARFAELFSVSNVEEHLRSLVTFSPRVTGYNGCSLAAEYIKKHFESLGLESSLHEYEVVVPVSYGASIELLDHPEVELRIYPMVPNLVSPVTTTGTLAPIIDVGDGDLRNIEGKEVNGSLLLMDWNSGWNWLQAVKFGAAGVIFVEPNSEPISVMDKWVDIPIKFLRYYMTFDDAVKLRKILSSEGQVMAHIKSKMAWEKRGASNVIAYLRGTVRADKIVMVTAHYDSYSVAPELSPGANSAVGVATLLELARVIKEVGSKYTILFVAYSGYYQNLWGAKNFVFDYFYDENSDLRSKVLMQIHLQISTETDILATNNIMGEIAESMLTLGGLPGYSYTVKVNNYVHQIMSIINRATGKSYKLVSALVGVPNDYGMSIYFPALAWNKGSDGSVLVAHGVAGLSILTVERAAYDWLPNDNLNRLNLENLRKNSMAASLLVYGIAATEGLEEYVRDFKYRNAWNTWRGRTAIFDEASNEYKPLPNALIIFSSGHSNLKYVGNIIQIEDFAKPTSSTVSIIMSDDEGRWEFTAPLGDLGPRDKIISNPERVPAYVYQAFVLDETTGEIIYAPTYGRFSWPSTNPPTITSGPEIRQYDLGWLTLGECGTLILTDLIYPNSLDTRYAGRHLQLSVEVLDAYTYVRPDFYGYFYAWHETYGIGIASIYVPPETPVMIMLRYDGLGDIPCGFLINASEEKPGGHGYKLRRGEQFIIPLSSYRIARDIYYVSSARLCELERYGLAGELLDRNEELALTLRRIEYYIAKKNYCEAFSLSYHAWAQALNNYIDVRLRYFDVIGTLPFLAILLVPFTVLFVPLIFGASGRKQIILILTVFAVTLTVFTILHPAFSLASNGPMSVVSVSIILMTMPVLLVPISKCRDSIKRLAIRVGGIHFSEISMGSASILAFQVGLENMKKRKVRSLLTFLTVILVVMAFTLFASISASRIVQPSLLQYPPSYSGIHIRTSDWIRTGGLSQTLLHYIEGRYGDEAIILPRAWKYCPAPGSSEGTEFYSYFRLYSGGKNVTYYGVLGISPEESHIRSGIEFAILWEHPDFGHSRPFHKGDEGNQVILIPSRMARELNIRVNDVVFTLQRNWTVIGIYNETILDKFRSLDDEMITPWDQRIPQQNNVHVSSAEIVIIPFSMLMQFNDVFLASIDIIPYDLSMVDDIASELFDSFHLLQFYVGYDGKVTYYSKKIIYSIIGWETQIVPILLCSLSILNIILGSVQERRKDIFTYSSIGLSPFHICFMFLAESSEFAIVGSIIGYLLAMGSIHVSRLMFPASAGPMMLNYSSTTVIYAIGITMALILISTLYPVRIASRIVTPSLQRVWNPTTKPIGDEWTIPIPFTAQNAAEAKAISNYIGEWLKMHGKGAEVFSADGLKLEEREDLILLSFIVRLEPYELGIQQSSMLILTKDAESNRWYMQIYAKRISGPNRIWKKMHLSFVDKVRRQLLIWGSLNPEQKSRYYS
ncbi:MAG: M28 family peptidase [Nitrososphaerota archaeon]|nr:M28 family peptidase [Candidatus Bathyarchaeota archaeon]MDW8049084.1 M28 family peptidase [Nitrososphaerota archaeon]